MEKEAIGDPPTLNGKLISIESQPKKVVVVFVVGLVVPVVVVKVSHRKPIFKVWSKLVNCCT